MGGILSEKLSTLVDIERAMKLTDRVQDLINKSSLHKMAQNKRNLENGDTEVTKKIKDEVDAVVAPPVVSTQLSPNQVLN